MAFTLKQKLHAWWEGYDLQALEAQREKVTQDQDLDGPDELSRVSDPNAITIDRLDFLQMLWGKGAIRPGNKEHYIKDSKTLLLTDSTSVAEFGGGLGAYGRAMAATNICYVDSYENDPMLVETADAYQATADEKKFTSYHRLELGDAPSGRTYHRALVNRYLHRLEDPVAMLGEIKLLLKEGGSILINEYTAGPRGLLPDSTQAMMDGFSAPHALIGRDIFCTALEELGFDVRTSEDRSAEHLGQIAAAWMQMDQQLVDAGEDFNLATYGGYLAQETTRWSVLSKALKDGQLEFSRIFALLK